MATTRRHRPTRAPDADPKNELEGSFQAKLLHTARCNGWRIDIADFAKEHRDPRFFRHLEAIAPKGKLRAFMDFLWGRKKGPIFSFGYHTHDSRNSQRGFPDVVLVHPRRRIVLFAELKKVGSYPTLQQRLWLAALRCVADAAPDVVKVHLWDPRDWPEIVEELGGVDPYAH